MPFVMCSVGGCDHKLQPIIKVDPRDRHTWLYRECEECARPMCEDHCFWEGRRVVCARCQKESVTGWVNLGVKIITDGP